MPFLTFLMNVGMAGAALLLGVMLSTLKVSGRVRGVGLTTVLMLGMGGIAALFVAREPVVDPVWLQFLLFAGIPFILGFAAFSVLVRRAYEG